MAGSRRSSSAKLVSTITRLGDARRRSSRIAPTPSSRGITRSMRITSGRRRSAARIASSPSPASPTTAMPSCSSRNVRSPSRTTAWSSTSRTPIASAIVDLEPDRRALAGRRADRQPAAEPLRALLHRGEPEPARAQLGVGGHEAGAVVGDLEDQPAVLAGEREGGTGRRRGAQRVLERLLRDPQDLAVAARVAADRSVGVERDVDVVELLERADVLAQRTAQPVALEVRRAQLEDQRAQLVERLAGQCLRPLDLRAPGTDVAVEQRRRRFGGEHEAEQLLADDVVQLEREPVAL